MPTQQLKSLTDSGGLSSRKRAQPSTSRDELTRENESYPDREKFDSNIEDDTEDDDCDEDQSICTTISNTEQRRIGDRLDPASLENDATKIRRESTCSSSGREFVLSVANLVSAPTAIDESKLVEIDLNEDDDEGRNKTMIRSPNCAIKQTTTTRGFSNSQPKLCIVSERIREYFDSIRSQNAQSETRRLYQFFKSVRTELVACLLFTLISSKVLIVLNGSSTGNKILSNLGAALANSFLVATLVQVFGHVSGCHLIPSITISLFIKNHITRLRLALYLFAQLIGSLIAILLLILLTTSQISRPNFEKELLPATRNHQRAAIDTHSLQKREATTAKATVLPFEQNATSSTHEDITNSLQLDGQGSESILISILEQQEQLLSSQRRQDSAPDANDVRSPQELEKIKTISAEADTEPTTANGAGTYPLLLSTISRRKPALDPATALVANPNNNENKSIRIAANGSSSAAPSLPQAKQADGGNLEPLQLLGGETRNLSQYRSSSSADNSLNKTTAKPVRKLMKRTRSRRNQPAAQNSSRSEAKQQSMMIMIGSNTVDGDNENYINLLELALPEPIMSSESIFSCIRAQEEASAARLNCLQLSNPSQMFIFQLLATLLINLTYLINVDPRRTDAGFKSLSIGLAYFVAHVVTVDSGGFYGNPFQLVFLSLFSSSNAASWRAEWLVYLATPILGGLLAALSHEYIDFTSLRNKNKQLHLRRSFYSLDNLANENHLEGKEAIELECNDSAADNNGRINEISLAQCTNGRARRQSSGSLAGSSGESTSSLSSLACEKHQANINSCPDNATNKSMANQSERAHCNQASYSRQIRLERHRFLQENDLNNNNDNSNCSAKVWTSPVRRSDFDSNFLISSSSPPNEQQQIALNQIMRPNKRPNGCPERFTTIGLM